MELFALFFFVIGIIGNARSQQSQYQKEADVNQYFIDSILRDSGIFRDAIIQNPKSIFINYYKGLNLLEQVEDSLKLAFFKEYGQAMAASKLYNESNDLAKKGIDLLKTTASQSEGIDLQFFYNQIAFNYLELKVNDSVIWAYKKNIEINNKEKIYWQNVSAYNNLGYHFLLNVKDNDSALFYLHKIWENKGRDIAFRKSLTLEASAKDNIALVYLDQGRYAEAGVLFKENYDYYSELKKGYLWRERWLRSGLQYLGVLLELGNLTKAKQLLIEIEQHFNAIPNFQEAPREFYPSKLRLLKMKQQYARATGNYREADLVGEAYLNLKDSINTNDSNKFLSDLNLIRKIGLFNAQNVIENEKAMSMIEKENLALDLKSRSEKVYWFISILALLMVMTVGYFYFKKMRRYDEEQNKMQVEYSQNLIKTQEDERRRVARELHDSVGQKLMLLFKTTKKIGDEDAENLASSTLEEVREISRGLHPANLERLGVTMAIKALIYEMNSNTDLFFTDEIEDIDGLLSKVYELHLYRIIQESLTNIVKHSEAKAVRINIGKTKENIQVCISDNGKGFDVRLSEQKKTLGMKTLFERAKIVNANINLKSSIGKGTVLTLNIPYSV